MVARPVFAVGDKPDCLATAKMIDFKWHAGFSLSQKQKNIESLHSNASSLGYRRILEVSTKSPDTTGVKASAHNLSIQSKHGRMIPVEVAFQTSKCFDRSGPFPELIDMASPKDVKKKVRELSDGPLKKFNLLGRIFPLQPATYFYDWLYINTLASQAELPGLLLNYDAFTDIEFNPAKSFSCQAFSVALFSGLVKFNILDKALMSPEAFLETLLPTYESVRLI